MNEYFISKDRLSRFKQEAINESRFFSATARMQTKRSRSAYSNEITIFLSHKHSDSDILEKILLIFDKLNVSVYIDWMDEDMPKITSATTALRIKNKIRSCKKFILLATEDAIASKWCNWELGFGDAHKFPFDIAIMPIASGNTNIFSGSEYLNIYPYIKSEYCYINGGYHVIYNGESTPLEQWIKQ